MLPHRSEEIAWQTSSAQVLEKRSYTPVSQCHMVTPTGTRDLDMCACTVHQLPHSTIFLPNSASDSYRTVEVGGMAQNPMLTSEKIFHV